MSNASEFRSRYSNAAELMTALDNAGVKSDQDWENERTTWTFDDGSQIVVSGSEIDVIDSDDTEENADDDTVRTVEYWWDNQDPSNAGWYARTRDASGQECDDSMKVWFPVEVDEYDETQGDDLAEALREAFPGAQVIAR
jgi:hypothetical protein